MPIYEYACPQGHTYDLTQGFDAEPEHPCRGDNCREVARRQFSLPAAIFRGSGWTTKKHGSQLPNPQETGYAVVSDSVKDGVKP